MTEEQYYKKQWEEDEDLQDEYSLEEWLEKKHTQCQCPMCQGIDIGPGYFPWIEDEVK
tara:strand:+ start:290 stop:463 length:174 start_codon:yes stop_codon:yes gene_type:complete